MTANRRSHIRIKSKELIEEEKYKRLLKGTNWDLAIAHLLMLFILIILIVISSLFLLTAFGIVSPNPPAMTGS